MKYKLNNYLAFLKVEAELTAKERYLNLKKMINIQKHIGGGSTELVLFVLYVSSTSHLIYRAVKMLKKFKNYKYPINELTKNIRI